MNQAERATLIRRGNELFNGRDFKNALKIFIATAYHQGIGRIATVMEHENKDKVAALKLYKQAKMNAQVERLSYDMAQSLRFLIKEDHIRQAQETGQNYNTGSKISGQAPSMVPSESIRIAKEKLGIKPNPQLSAAEHDGRITPWRPITISKSELHNIRKNNE